MKTSNLALFVLIVSLGSMNLSASNNNPGGQPNISNAESITLTNKIVKMPVPPEDVNSDGVVDSDDLAICLIELYDYCSENCQADVNGDTYTDLTDLLTIYNYICSHLNS